MPYSTKNPNKSNARSPYQAQVIEKLSSELLKRPNIGREIAAARLLAMLDPADAVVEAERNESTFADLGLHKEFVVGLADKIRKHVIAKGQTPSPDSVRKALPL